VDADSPWYPVTEMRFSSGTGEAALKLQVCVYVLLPLLQLLLLHLMVVW